MQNIDGAAPGSFELGVETMREMWGDGPVDAFEAMSSDFSRGIYELVVASCFGACWSDDTLSPRERSLITLAINASLGRTEETEFHFRMALENGCTADELREVGKHVTAYAGAPGGVQLGQIGDKVLAERAA